MGVARDVLLKMQVGHPLTAAPAFDLDGILPTPFVEVLARCLVGGQKSLPLGFKSIRHLVNDPYPGVLWHPHLPLTLAQVVVELLEPRDREAVVAPQKVIEPDVYIEGGPARVFPVSVFVDSRPGPNGGAISGWVGRLDLAGRNNAAPLVTETHQEDAVSHRYALGDPAAPRVRRSLTRCRLREVLLQIIPREVLSRIPGQQVCHHFILLQSVQSTLRALVDLSSPRCVMVLKSSLFPRSRQSSTSPRLPRR